MCVVSYALLKSVHPFFDTILPDEVAYIAVGIRDFELSVDAFL